MMSTYAGKFTQTVQIYLFSLSTFESPNYITSLWLHYIHEEESK